MAFISICFKNPSHWEIILISLQQRQQNIDVVCNFSIINQCQKAQKPLKCCLNQHTDFKFKYFFKCYVEVKSTRRYVNMCRNLKFAPKYIVTAPCKQ